MSKSSEHDEKFFPLWRSLDHDAIVAEIKNTGGRAAYEFDLDEACDVLLVAAHRWLLEDLEQLNVTEVEKEYVTNSFKFVQDLGGTFTGNGVKLVQWDSRKYGESLMTRYEGKTFTADWKTTEADLDTRWQDRLLDSWQWRDYLAETGSDYFVYRGLKRRKEIGDEVETREFYIERTVQPDLVRVHEVNLTGVSTMRDALIDRGVTPWPQNRPSGCRAFGRLCPYKDDCDTGLKFIPIDNLTKGRVLSYSRMEEFKLCPERHRRSVIDRTSGFEEESAGPAAEFGKAIHRGLAAVWKQSFNLA